MTFIKSLKMRGFKSFAKPTELVFDKDLSIIVGPNGSGKSNITEAICFVLGRLSAKSMRAEKSANLIYTGGKNLKPADEAVVDLILDNSKNTFPIEGDIKISRIVRHDGNSIYRINNKTTTRQEMQELLGHANIDPKGFNIVLQEEITQFIEMHPEDRRKIIEEIAGIRIYEERKEKSQHELEKTEEKLKEVSIILNQRRVYMKGLEHDKSEALKYKKHEETVKKCKATLLYKDLSEKDGELKGTNDEIEKRNKIVEDKKKLFAENENSINKLKEEINNINKHIHESTGIEQENLSNEIIELKQLTAGLNARKENCEAKIEENERRQKQFETSIAEYELEIEGLKKSKPKAVVKEREDIDNANKQLEEAESKRIEFYKVKQKFNDSKNNLSTKRDIFLRIKNQSEFIVNQIEHSSSQLSELTEDLDGVNQKLEALKKQQNEDKIKLDEDYKKIIELEKNASKHELEIVRQQKIKQDVSKIDICPLCKTKLTAEHIQHVFDDANKISETSEKAINKVSKELEKIKGKNIKAKLEIEEQENLIRKKEYDLTHINNILSQKEHLHKLEEDENQVLVEIKTLEIENKRLENDIEKFANIEENYDNLRVKVQQLSEIAEENRDAHLSIKTLELEKAKNEIKRISREQDENDSSLNDLCSELGKKSLILEKKEKQNEVLKEKFQKLYSQKAEIQEKISNAEKEQIRLEGETRQEEDSINNFKINKARINADKEIINGQFSEFKGIEIIKGDKERVIELMKNAQESLIRIGNVNMRALEVYEDVRKQYEEVDEKTKKLGAEKQEILNIIQEIDIKKRKTFMKVFTATNEKFTNNFSKLVFNKGPAFLEIENEENPFEAGVDVKVRIAKGKYLDISSLSGGERALAALALIFAIQEYNPHHFYIFDEIDAALDKRNSEKLSTLISESIGKAQYIIISHNDAMTTQTNAKVLYGVSMQDGISKALSLKI